MPGVGMIGLLLIIINFIVSYRGFKDYGFFNRYKFSVDSVRLQKDYKRLVTSDFLHVSWTHLIFNMLSLMIFSAPVEAYLGSLNFLLIYVASMIGCNLLTLLIHWRDGDYSSVGASGAVSGVIFAAIALFPGMKMGLFFLPLHIPAWIFGLLYVGFSMWGIKSKRDNIGHEAHLGGALVGMAMAILIHPAAFLQNYWVILLITVPALIFLYLIVKRPHLLLVDNQFFKTHNNDHYSVDHKYNEARANRQQEIDRILDKIGRSGMGSLSEKERQLLKRHSRSLR